jgi:GntR family transcriptional regulator
MSQCLYKLRMARQPLYAQIKDSILAQLRSGQLSEGQLLAPEVDLARRFGVSRPTVRQAILELVAEGIVTRVPGRGTVVLPQRRPYPVRRLMSFSEEFAGLGRMLRATVCRQGVIRADAELAQRLGEPESVPVFLLERVRFVDDEPMALQRSYIAHRHVPGIEEVDFTSESLYEVLSRRFGLWIDHADERILASTADASAAELLGVAPGSPVFEIERRSYQRPQRLVELVDSVYRADRYEVRLRLRR